MHDKFMFYKGRNETIVKGQDCDWWSYFEVVSLVRDLGYEGFRLWRKFSRFDEWYFHFIYDLQAEEIAKYNLANNVDCYIWVEPDVEEMLSKVLKPIVDHFCERSDDGSNVNDVRGIRFNDREEERTI